jgi:hypothetical protein
MLTKFEPTKQSIRFTNGSTITAVPTSPDAGRSEALALLIVDEAAFIRDFDEIWTSLYPTLSTGGSAIILSTPNGVGGQYYKLWTEAESGANDFNPIRLPWNVHPEHNQPWFDKETRNLTKRQIAQEFLCDFVSSGDTFLQPTEFEKLRTMIKPPLLKEGPQNGVWIWKNPEQGRKYVISADVSRGDAADFSTFHVIDYETCEVCVEFMGKIPPDRFAELLSTYGRRYNQALICPEQNTFGYFTCTKLRDEGYPHLFYQQNGGDLFGYKPTDPESVPGFSTQTKTRTQILTKLEEVIRNKQIRIRSTRMSEELKTFTWIGQTAKAMKGYNDDLVMALAIGIWLYDTNIDYSRQSQEISRAMLSAFSVNKREHDEQPFVPHARNPMSPIMIDAAPTNAVKSMNPYAHFGWLVRG